MANSAEAIVAAALKPLVSNADGSFRIYPDVAPTGAARPYITYQGAGGQTLNYLSNTVALRNARMQVNVWADSRFAEIQLMQSVLDTLSAAPVNAPSIGERVPAYESDTKLFGSRMDFSIWFTP